MIDGDFAAGLGGSATDEIGEGLADLFVAAAAGTVAAAAVDTVLGAPRSIVVLSARDWSDQTANKNKQKGRQKCLASAIEPIYHSGS